DTLPALSASPLPALRLQWRRQWRSLIAGQAPRYRACMLPPALWLLQRAEWPRRTTARRTYILRCIGLSSSLDTLRSIEPLARLFVSTPRSTAPQVRWRVVPICEPPVQAVRRFGHTLMRLWLFLLCPSL